MPVNLPTNVLRSFVAIVDSGSKLSASERVFVTQSALSLQVKRLEEMLQRSLFARDGRRLSLTPAGEVLLGHAKRLLSLNDEVVAAMSHAESRIAPNPVEDPALIGADRIHCTGRCKSFPECPPYSTC